MRPTEPIIPELFYSLDGKVELNLNQVDNVFKVFQGNYNKHPKEFTTHVGMGR